MNKNWASNFSYEYYRELLKIAKRRYAIRPLSKAPSLLTQISDNNTHMLLRHDIDVSLTRAVPMAEIESDLGIHSTYMVIVDSPLYSIREKSSIRIMKYLRSLGHEIGLHYNVADKKRQKNVTIREVHRQIAKACSLLEEVIETKVSTISFHRPLTQFLRGNMFVVDRVNAYAAKLMDWYISDSKGSFREGEPLSMLLSPKHQLLQLLIHPIWWGETHQNPQNRLQNFFEEMIKNKTKHYTMKFSKSLASEVPSVMRSGLII